MTRLWHFSLIAFLALNTLGLGILFWRVNKLADQFPADILTVTLKSQADIVARLTALQNQTVTTASRSPSAHVLGVADLLPEKAGNPTATSNTFIWVKKDSVGQVLVYKEQADFSAVVGELVPEYQYTYFAKTDGWYLVNFSEGKTGWVKAALVTETHE